jgi:hypothetical protein
MATFREQVAKLYVANFNRAPDSAGLDYWTNSGSYAGNGSTLTNMNQIAKAMQAGSEASEGVASMSNSDYVISLYNSLFGKSVDNSDAGVEYWVGEIASGNVERANMIQTLILGAEADTGDANDAAVLANKTEVGLYYADTLGLSGTDFSLADITALVDSVTSIKALADIYKTQSDTSSDSEDDSTDDTSSSDSLTLDDIVGNYTIQSATLDYNKDGVADLVFSTDQLTGTMVVNSDSTYSEMLNLLGSVGTDNGIINEIVNNTLYVYSYTDEDYYEASVTQNSGYITIITDDVYDTGAIETIDWVLI